MRKVVGMSIGPQDNIAATAAVTAIRSSFRNEFLTPETDTPASALSGLRKNFDTIDKHRAANCHSTHALSSHLLCHCVPHALNDANHHTIKKTCDWLRDPSPSDAAQDDIAPHFNPLH
jgi:hypothetical protein